MLGGARRQGQDMQFTVQNSNADGIMSTAVMQPIQFIRY